MTLAEVISRLQAVKRTVDGTLNELAGMAPGEMPVKPVCEHDAGRAFKPLPVQAGQKRKRCHLCGVVEPL